MDGPDERRLVPRRRSTRRPGRRLRLLLDGGAAAPDPRSPWQPDGVHGPSRLVDHAAFAWTDGGWQAARRWPRRSSTSCTSARSRPRAPSTAPSRASTTSSTWASTHVELHAGRRVPGPAGLGLRRRRPLRAPPRLRRARRAQAPGRRLPRPRPGGDPRRRLQPPRPGGELPRPSSGRTSPTATARRGARRSTSTAPTATRCGASSSTTPSCGCATTTSTACGSTPSTPSSTPRPSTSSRSWPARSTTLDGRARPAAVPHRRERPQRPPARAPTGSSAATASTPSGATTSTTPSTPSSPASATGYYADFGSLDQLAKALRQAFVYDGGYSPHRRRRHGRPPAGAARHPLPRLPPEPRPGRQPGPRRAAVACCSSDGLLKVAAALVLLGAVRADAVPGRGVGGVHAVPVLHRPRRPRAGRGGQRGPAAGVRRLRLGRPSDVPDPQDPETFERSKLDWDELRTSHRTPACSTGTAA